MGGRADDNTKGAVLDGPRLARGVAKSEANEGEVPAGENGEGSDGKWGDTGVDGVVELDKLPVENIGAELRNDSSCESTEKGECK